MSSEGIWAGVACAAQRSLSAESQARCREGQPVAPAQPTIPEACNGVPTNVLCR
jgi:hypothetical protein